MFVVIHDIASNGVHVENNCGQIRKEKEKEKEKKMAEGAVEYLFYLWRGPKTTIFLHSF